MTSLPLENSAEAAYKGYLNEMSTVPAFFDHFGNVPVRGTFVVSVDLSRLSSRAGEASYKSGQLRSPNDPFQVGIHNRVPSRNH